MDAVKEFLHWVPDTGVFLEIGSFDGTDALWMKEKFPDREIHAFECNPEQIPVCEKNLQNSGVIFHPYGICTKRGMKRFYAVDEKKYENTGVSSLYLIEFDRPEEDEDHVFNGQCIQKRVHARFRRLDEVMEEYKIDKVGLCAIDVQGHELKVLQSMGDRIQDVSVIIVEAAMKSTYKGGCNFKEIDEWLSKYGFKYRYSNKFNEDFPSGNLPYDFNCVYTRAV